MSKHIQGAGLGFRRELLQDYHENDLSHIDFFELAPENWINLGGKFEQQLRHFTERFAFACHGLSLSIGGADPLDERLLKDIRQFMDTHGITLYTEHLSWCANQGQLYDLLPVPFTEESAHWVAERVKRAQDILGRQIGLENASYYIRPPQSTMTEADYINRVIELSGCFLHLDVNNLYVNSQNLNYSPHDYLAAINPKHVGYLHMAGHYVEADGWIVDTHGAEVIPPVWRLLEQTYAWLGERTHQIGTCLERDFNFPDFSTLADEVKKIAALQAATNQGNRSKANTIEARP